MASSRFILAGIMVLSLSTSAITLAEEASKQSAASRQSAKARDYANRQDKDGPSDVAAASAVDSADPKDGGKLPALDSPVVDKAAKDTGDNWKKLDKVLDRF